MAHIFGRKRTARLERELADAVAKRDELAAWAKRFEGLGGVEKADLFRELERVRAESAELKWQAEEATNRLAKALAEIDNMGRRVNDLQSNLSKRAEPNREVGTLKAELAAANRETARAWEAVEVAKIQAEVPVKEALAKLASYPVVICQCGNVRNGSYKECFVCGSDVVSYRSGVR